MTSKEFIKQRAKELGVSMKTYKDGMKYHYVIYVNSKEKDKRDVLTYRNGAPAVFGGIEDLIYNFNGGDICDDDIVLTEAEYVNNFMDMEDKPYFDKISLRTEEYNGTAYKRLILCL